MAKCPACTSKRVYKGYRLAPLPLRLVRIHEFLCEDCNLQFRAFSVLPPKTRRRKNGNKKNKHTQTDASSVSQVEAQEYTATVRQTNSTPIEKLMVAQAPSAKSASASVNQTVSATPVPPSEPPAPAPPAKTAAPQWQMSAQQLEEAAARHSSGESKRSHRSHQVCPHCGATDTERRRRKLWEKIAFAFTTIRAYNCRICGGDFYAKRKVKSESEAA